MSFDLEALTYAATEYGEVARVVVVQTKGSVPRDAGTSMLVWETGQSGTIGGGALEFEAVKYARKSIERKIPHAAKTYPLGPAVGQCCGGSVTLLYQWFGADCLPTEFPVATPVLSAGMTRPPSVEIAIKTGVDAPTYLADWFIEPLSQASRPIWIYGAGHVGRALVSVLAGLPDLAITWVDTIADRYPHEIPARVTPLVAANPADIVRYAPREADHLVLTYSHKMDLEICHALLGHGFRYAGLIGSDTKWARFRKRLAELGHDPAVIDQIACPIGRPALGKHPQAIAIGVAAELLGRSQARASEKERRA